MQALYANTAIQHTDIAGEPFGANPSGVICIWGAIHR